MGMPVTCVGRASLALHGTEPALSSAPVTVTKRGTTWTGTAAGDVDEYLRAYAAGGYAVAVVVHAVCASCGNSEQGFSVALDDEEGAAVRQCLKCQSQTPMLDSANYLDDADLGAAACPCGHEAFDVAVGFSLREDGEVRWVSIGLRCRNDGVLGVYADWKVDYSPSRHLMGAV
jgi:hypothetical protein